VRSAAFRKSAFSFAKAFSIGDFLPAQPPVPEDRCSYSDEGANSVLQSVINGDAELGLNMLGAQEPELVFEPLLERPRLQRRP
jgi:hypothetical protein